MLREGGERDPRAGKAGSVNLSARFGRESGSLEAPDVHLPNLDFGLNDVHSPGGPSIFRALYDCALSGITAISIQRCQAWCRAEIGQNLESDKSLWAPAWSVVVSCW